MLAGEPSFDLWPVDIRRFARFHGNRTWLRERVREELGLHYAMAWPNREPLSARPLRRSALYERLAAKGAVFGSKAGWERANWFAPAGAPRQTQYSWGRQNWFEAVADEHRACRERAALFDLTSFAKLLVQGRDAERVLQHFCANDVALPVGQSAYTPMLNSRGGYESDLTVARLAPETFLLLTGTAQATRYVDWITRQIPDDACAVLTDVTSAFAVLALAGPRSRALLSRVSRAPLDNAAFPPAAVREIDIGHATGWAVRRSYAGELGWELVVPTEFAATAYDALWQAGGDLGLVDAGYYALESLRVEKGYRAWGRELTPDCTPWAAWLGFAVKLGKETDFIGRDALLAARAKPLCERLVCFMGIEPEAPVAWGGELVSADGMAVGELTSAAYGHSLGRMAALGWVRRADGPVDESWLAGRRFFVDVAGESVAVRAQLAPFW
ncbi:MAG: glycine cleavage T C-terminal barrel domain-containing protein, partial [Acetobacteraceae bacterium]